MVIGYNPIIMPIRLIDILLLLTITSNIAIGVIATTIVIGTAAVIDIVVISLYTAVSC